MILVTGGSGLVGRYLLVELLSKGEQVRALYHKTPLQQQHPNLRQFQGDLTDVVATEEMLVGVDKIYNCAGLVSFSPKMKKQLHKVNVEGTANLVNAAIEAGVKKMVHISSVAALGRIRQGELINEKATWTKDSSNSVYAETKHLGEMEVWRGVAEGLNAVVVNPSLIFGPADWNESSTKIFKTVYDEFPWYTTGVTGVVDVRDVVSAMIGLMNSDVSAEKFILSGHNVSYKDLFETIAIAFNKKPPTREVTPMLASLVWRWEKIKSAFTGLDPLVTEETTNTALAKIYYDHSKLKRFLPGFEFKPMQETINFTVQGLQQKLNKQ